MIGLPSLSTTFAPTDRKTSSPFPSTSSAWSYVSAFTDMPLTVTRNLPDPVDVESQAVTVGGAVDGGGGGVDAGGEVGGPVTLGGAEVGGAVGGVVTDSDRVGGAGVLGTGFVCPTS